MNTQTLEYIKDRANESETGSIKAVSCADVRQLIAELEATRASLNMANDSVKHLKNENTRLHTALNEWIESGIKGAAEASKLFQSLKTLLDALSRNGGSDSVAVTVAKKNAREAIAKAQG